MNYTKKNTDFSTLSTLLKIKIKGDGDSLFEYNLPNPHNYIRYNTNEFTIEYLLDGLFNTKKGMDYLNDILFRFNTSMDIIKIETKIVNKNNRKTYHLSDFQNLNSIKKNPIPNHIKRDDVVFWGIKLFVESMLKNGSGFIPYETLLDYSINHYIDKKDYSTIKSKVRSIWNWYNERDWKPTQKKEKIYKNNEEKFKGTKLNRIENLKKISLKKEKENYQRIINTITGLFSHTYLKKDGSWNITKLSNDLNLSRPTIMKHLNSYLTKKTTPKTDEKEKILINKQKILKKRMEKIQNLKKEINQTNIEIENLKNEIEEIKKEINQTEKMEKLKE